MVLAVALFTASCGEDKPQEIDLSKLDNTTAKCWEITVKVMGIPVTTYAWGTEREVVGAVQLSQEYVGKSIKLTWKENSAKSEEACERQNPDYEPHSCWKLTRYMSTATIVEYEWDSEEGIKALVAQYEKIGYRCTYEKADAKDSEACSKLNDNENPPIPDFDNTTFKCWEVTATIGAQSEVGYIWTTEYLLNNVVIAAAKQKVPEAEYSYKAVDAASEEACEALNPDVPQPEEEACWKVTLVNVDGQTEVGYHWTTESDVKEYIEARGGRGSYELAAADDRDACEKLNDNPGPDPDEFDGSKYDNETLKCWEVVTSYGDMSVTNYVWNTEYNIAYSIWVSKIDATFTPANAADEEACNALEEATQGEEACYKIIVNYLGVTQIEYIWTTSKNITTIVGSMKENMEIEGNLNVDISYEISNAQDEDACDALQQAVEDEFNKKAKCWEITAVLMGQTLATGYMWFPEESLAAIIENAKQMYATAYGITGVEITYKEASATDEDSCNALNPDLDDPEPSANIRALLKGALGK